MLIAAVLFFYPSFPYRTGAEGAMVCLIAPTATAAAVITGKLGGNEASLTSYTIISNMAAAVSIPIIFPLIEGRGDATFIQQLMVISRQVFPLLIFPFFLACFYPNCWRSFLNIAAHSHSISGGLP